MTFSQLDLLFQHAQSYHNALVLYTTAALCEHMSSEVLQSVKMSLLLEAVSSIVGSHAHFVSPPPPPGSEKTTSFGTSVDSSQSCGKESGKKGASGGKGLFLMVGGGGRDLDELPGSSITLSIVFGLLSAILGGGREVSIIIIL